MTGLTPGPGRSSAPRARPTVSGGEITPTPDEMVGPLDNGEFEEDGGVLDGLLGDLF